jgi:hypothetical protein
MWPKQSLQMFQIKTTSNGRLPQISKMKYFSNYWSDLPQILNLGLCDQSKRYKCFQWRQPQKKNDLIRLSKVKYLVWSCPNFKLRLMWLKQILQMFQMKTTSDGRQPQMEDYHTYQKCNIAATTGRIFPKLETFEWRQPSMVDDLNW